MRRLLCTLTQALFATAVLISQQSQAESDPPSNSNRYEWSAQTATVDGRVRVTITKTKHKLHLPKPHRPVIRLSVDDREDDYYAELVEFQVGYRRPELVNQTAKVHDDLSDEIKIRLLLARKRALEAYDNKWA